MKKFLFVVFLILAVAGGVVYYVMPSNYDWDGYVKEVTEQVRKQTGLTLRIQGKPQFFMTPSPSLKVGAVTLSNVREGTFPQILEAQSAEFQFDKGLALKRQVHVKKIILKNPKLFLERLPDGKWNWQAAFFDRQQNGAKLGFSSLLVNDAVVNVKHDKYTPVDVWNNMNAELLADSATGPFFFEGNVAAKGTTFGFSFKADKFGKGESPDVSLRVIHAPAEATFGFSGKYGLGAGDKGDITGNLTFDVRKTEALFALFSKQKLPAELFQPLVGSVKIKNTAATRENVLSDFLFKYGQSSATGTVKIKTLSPEEAGALQAQEEKVDDLDLVLRDPNNPETVVSVDDAPAVETNLAEFLLPKEYEVSFIFTKFAGDVFFNNLKAMAEALAASGTFASKSRNKVAVDLTFDAAEYRNSMIRRLKVKADAVEKGLRLSTVSALLPGEVNVAGRGMLTLAKKPVLDFAVGAEGESLAAFLRWAGVPFDEDVSSGAMKTFTVKAVVKAAENALSVKGVDAVLDGENIRGAAAVRFGARPAVQIAAAVSNFDAALYFPTKDKAFAERWENAKTQSFVEKTAALTDYWRFTGDTDAAVNLTADSLKFGGISARDAKISFVAQNGIVTLKDISAQNVWGADIKLAGTLKQPGENTLLENLSVDVKTDNAPLFLKNIGIEQFPEELLKQNKLSLSAVLNGNADDLAFKSNLRSGTFGVEADGTVKHFEKGNELNFLTTVKHENFRQFVRLFTNKYRPMSANPGAMTLAARVSVEPSRVKLSDVELSVGHSALKGTLDWDKSGEKPKLTLSAEATKLYYAELMPSLNVWPDFKTKEVDEQAKLFSVNGTLAALETLSLPKEKFDFDFAKDADVQLDLRAEKLYVPGFSMDNFAASLTASENAFKIGVTDGTLEGASLRLQVDGTLTNGTSEMLVTANAGNIRIPAALFDAGAIDVKGLENGAVDFNVNGKGASMFDFVASASGEGKFFFDKAVLTGVNIDAAEKRLANMTPETAGLVKSAILSGSTVFNRGEMPFTLRNGKLISDNVQAQYGKNKVDKIGGMSEDLLSAELRVELKLPVNDSELALYITKRSGQMIVIGDNIGDLTDAALRQYQAKQELDAENRKKASAAKEKKNREEHEKRQKALFELEGKFAADVQELVKKIENLKPYADVYQVQRYFSPLSEARSAAEALLDEIRKTARSNDIKVDDFSKYSRLTREKLLNRQNELNQDYRLAMKLGVKGRILDLRTQVNSALSDLTTKKMRYAEVPQIQTAMDKIIKLVDRLKKIEDQAENENTLEKLTVLQSEAQTVYDGAMQENAGANQAIREYEERTKAQAEAARIAEEARLKAEAEAKAAEEARLKAEAEAKAAAEKKRQATIHRRGSSGEESNNSAAVLEPAGDLPDLTVQAAPAAASKPSGIIRRR